MQHLTAILVVRQHPKNDLPDGMEQYPEFSFIMTEQAIDQRSISTDGIRFQTFLKHEPNKVDVFLPSGAWMYLKIKETSQRFDLSFEEDFHHPNSFPEGIHLHRVPAHLQDPLEDDVFSHTSLARSTESISQIPNSDRPASPHPVGKTFLRLVVNNVDPPLTPPSPVDLASHEQRPSKNQESDPDISTD